MSDSHPVRRWTGRIKLTHPSTWGKVDYHKVIDDILHKMPKRQAQVDAFLKRMGMMPYAPGENNPWPFIWDDWVRDFPIVAKVVHMHQGPDVPMRYFSTEKLENDLRAALEAYVEDPTTAPDVYYAVQQMIDKDRALKVVLRTWPVHEQPGPDQISATQAKNADGLLAERYEALSKLERQVLPQVMQEAKKRTMTLLRSIDWELKGDTYVARISEQDGRLLAQQLVKLGHGKVVESVSKRDLPEIHFTDEDMKALKLGPYRKRKEPGPAR